MLENWKVSAAFARPNTNVVNLNSVKPNNARGNFERAPTLSGYWLYLGASLVRFMTKLNKIHRLRMIIIKI